MKLLKETQFDIDINHNSKEINQKKVFVHKFIQKKLELVKENLREIE